MRRRLAYNFATLCIVLASLSLSPTGIASALDFQSDERAWLDYGNNINESLLNPLDPTTTEAALTQQVAGILHTIRMDGGFVVRWFVSDVWPQYSCSRDPENQQTGQIDPAWFIISQTLLKEAQREGVAVVIVMADTADETFVWLPASVNERTKVISEWYKHYENTRLTDERADLNRSCKQSFQNGYMGEISPRALFENPKIVSHFEHRFFQMAEFLKNFPALAALEMFNEPSFIETERSEFSASIAHIRNSLYEGDPSLRKIPIYSGVAWWNDKIAKNLDSSGDLPNEPYVSLHYYRKSGVDAGDLPAKIATIAAYVRSLTPSKEVIVAEAGSEAPIYDLIEHTAVLNSFIAAKREAHVGMWFWGVYADDLRLKPNFGMEFNSTALSGGSFRNTTIATEREASYAAGKRVIFTDEQTGKTHEDPVTIARLPIDHANPLWKLRWTLKVSDDLFISVSRAGVLLRDPTPFDGRPVPAASVVAISESYQRREWAEIKKDGSDWRIGIYRCGADNSDRVQDPTPPYVISYAESLGRNDFDTCTRSIFLSTARLR